MRPRYLALAAFIICLPPEKPRDSFFPISPLARAKFQVFKFQVYLLYIKKLLQSNLTDLQVAKTNRGRSVSQVLKYYRCQKRKR